MIRLALATLLLSTALPFATALAQTKAEPEVTPAAPVEVTAPVEAAPTQRPTVAPSDPPITTPDPADEATPPLPTAAPAASPTAAPTPAEVGSAPSPVASPVTPAPTIGRDGANRGPGTLARASHRGKPPKPRAATAVTIVNGREIPATTITVMADARTVSHSKPLAPSAKVSLKLPKMKGCLITVAATFEGGSVSDGGTIDVCKVRLVRLTD